MQECEGKDSIPQEERAEQSETVELEAKPRTQHEQSKKKNQKKQTIDH